MKNIKVEDVDWRKLQLLKIKNNNKSMADVISNLLNVESAKEITIEVKKDGSEK